MAVNDLFEKLVSGNKTALARAITLVESQNPAHRKEAAALVAGAIQAKRDSVRIGITGVPGVGKSTFIDAFGSWLVTQKGKKVCVLAIDPSSSLSHGSILADKTRMETLSSLPDVFIRPTPAGTNLGGIGGNTMETILLCEAAGYNYILVETVGVGQNEYLADQVVDCLVLLLLANAGDEMQGIKRGIMELADLIILNKADNFDPKQLNAAKGELISAVQLLPQRYTGWMPPVLQHGLNAASNAAGIYESIESFIRFQKAHGHFSKKRDEQIRQWFLSYLKHKLETEFFGNDAVKREIESDIRSRIVETDSFEKLAEDIITRWRKA